MSIFGNSYLTYAIIGKLSQFDKELITEHQNYARKILIWRCFVPRCFVPQHALREEKILLKSCIFQILTREEKQHMVAKKGLMHLAPTLWSWGLFIWEYYFIHLLYTIITHCHRILTYPSEHLQLLSNKMDQGLPDWLPLNVANSIN